MATECSASFPFANRPPASPVATQLASTQLAGQETYDGHGFFPSEPETLHDAGLTSNETESLILKYLLNTGTANGRHIANQIKLPFIIVREILDSLKAQLLVSYRDSAAMGDYHYELSEAGLSRARRRSERCTYFGRILSGSVTTSTA